MESDVGVQWSGAVAKNATIDLVLSQDTETTSGVDLSALYVVENNLAPVMTMTFGECEAALGAAGNQFYNALWEQAAAQGITVVVAAGDSGSGNCDPAWYPHQSAADHGLAVNGLASTPFNIAVGGTDFNDVGSQISYWNSNNDGATGESAKSYIPEIPWNSTCARNSSVTLTGCSAPDMFNAGGGGPSSLYAKPAWQMGPGVPIGNQRDLPDVSLFAALGGYPGSLSWYLICEMDVSGALGSNGTSCDLNSPYNDFLGVSGTSASAAAFAGIMALINQKTGERQGNTNYVLYNIAAQAGMSCSSDSAAVTSNSCTFYDIATGNNSIVCYGSSPNCSSSGPPAAFGVLVDPAKPAQPAWLAGAGYDMATGLGSINAANLVKNWSTATFVPTATRLALSPTTITHGQPVAISVSVTPASGSGTPTGDVSLIAQGNSNPANTAAGVGPFTLSSGSISGTTTDMLPGGTYNITAHYAGDGTFGASDSLPVQVTVGKEKSNPVIHLLSIDPNTGAVTNPNTTSAVYGSSLFTLRVDVANSSGQNCSANSTACPTGQVAISTNVGLLDKGTYALNSQGYTEDQLTQLPGGTDNVTANYSGDDSFSSSSSTSAIAISTNPTTLGPVNASGPSWNGEPALNVPVTVGTSATPTAGDSGVSPTGTFTFYADGSPLPGSVTVRPTLGKTLSASLTATFTTLGNHTLTATYSGDQNYGPSNSSPAVVNFRYFDTATITANPASVAQGSPVTLTAVVDTSNKSPAPTGTVQFCCDSAMLNGTVTVTPITDAQGNVALQATETYVPSASGVNVWARYSGDSNYIDNDTGMISVTFLPAFSLAAASESLSLHPGSQTNDVITVAPQNGSFGGLVQLSCAVTGSTPLATCSLSPTSVTPGANSATSILTINAPAQSAKVGRSVLYAVFVPIPLALISMGFGFNKPNQRKRKMLLLCGLLVAFVALQAACGGGSSIQQKQTQTLNYTVTITGTSGTIHHTAQVTVTVQ